MPVAGLLPPWRLIGPRKAAGPRAIHDFCLDHVKEYNKTYNYFAGMDDEAVRVFQKADADRSPTHLEARQNPGRN